MSCAYCGVDSRHPENRHPPTTDRALSLEHALEDRVDVLEVEAEVEVLLDLGIAEMFGHVLVGLEQREEIAFAAPDRHRVALNQPVGVLARGALLRQRQHHAL